MNNIREQYWQHLDLQYIADYMSQTAYPLPRWPSELAKECMLYYKRYLKLCMLYPREILVPSKEIDEFWHNHILHTKRYHIDCENLFSYYLHHTPSNSSDDNDSEVLLAGFKRMKQYYLETFSEPLKILT